MNLQHFVDKMLTLKGAIAAAIVDFESGMLMASGSNDPAFDLEVVAARGSEVMRAKIKTMQKLEMDDANTIFSAPSNNTAICSSTLP